MECEHSIYDRFGDANAKSDAIEPIYTATIDTKNARSPAHVNLSLLAAVGQKATALVDMSRFDEALVILDKINYEAFNSAFILPAHYATFCNLKSKIAVLLLRCQEHDRAFQLATEAAQALHHTNRPFDAASAYEALSCICEKQGKFQQALEALQTANCFYQSQESYSFE